MTVSHKVFAWLLKFLKWDVSSFCSWRFSFGSVMILSLFSGAFVGYFDCYLAVVQGGLKEGPLYRTEGRQNEPQVRKSTKVRSQARIVQKN